jgi:hypothetical protein
VRNREEGRSLDMTKVWRWAAVLVVLAAVALPGCGVPHRAAPAAEAPKAAAPAAPTAGARHAVVDNHLHYLDFVQKTDGFESLVRAMDAAGVEKAVVFGIPMVKMWTESDPLPPVYYMDTDSRAYYYSGTDFILAHDLARQPREVQGRFFPFLCGLNPVDLNAADQAEMLLRMHPGFWKGIGELMSRHDDLTALTYGEPPRADHPALMRVYQLGARHKLPVLLHHNISSAWKREPIYLKELENAVRANPQTTFIWAHAGISRRVDVPTLLPELRRVLAAYPNLAIDISWVVYPDYIAKDKESMNRWVAFIEEYPDRVMIGSDKVAHWAGYGEEITKYHGLLDRLKPATAVQVAKGNILRILGADAR